MEPQIDEVDTLEIEIEDMEAARNLAAGEGLVDKDQLRQTMQMAKSPKGQKKQVKFSNNEEQAEEKSNTQAQAPRFKSFASNTAASASNERNARRMNRRFIRFLKYLPVTREKLTNLRKVRILNEFKESKGCQRIFTFLFCVYWMLNMVLGLFIVDEYKEQLDSQFPDFTAYVLFISLKWFTSIGLAMLLILLISLGSAYQCLTGDADEIKASIIGMALPLYFVCVTIQQIYATGYGVWFFQAVADAGESGGDLPRFDQMETDCLDLCKVFFFNEVAVGAMTFWQCIGLFLCSEKSKHLREIEGEDDPCDKRVAYYKRQLEEKRISCRPSPTGSTTDDAEIA